jgi:hypothetical protein
MEKRIMVASLALLLAVGASAGAQAQSGTVHQFVARHPDEGCKQARE